MTMLQITERWSVYCDSYQWILVETYTGKDKHGNPKQHTRETYHAWLDQAMRYAAHREIADSDSLESLKAVEEVYTRLNHALNDSSRALGRGYREVHDTLLDTKAQLRDALSRLRKFEQEKAA